MKQALKKAWIEALRSRKYKQGENYLMIEANGKFQYCCLGVLCVVAGMKPKSVMYGIHTFDGQGGTLTEKLKKRFGLDNKAANRLVNMNDSEGKKFY